MRDSERQAKQVLEAAFPGTVLHYQSSQANGENDFNVEWADGRTEPLEVTVSTNERAEKLWASLHGANGDARVERRLSENDRMLIVAENVNLKKVRGSLDEYVHAIEHEGIASFTHEIDAGSSMAVRAIGDDLRVIHGNVLKLKQPGSLLLTTPAYGGLVTSESVSVVVREEAWKEDNRRKRGRSDAEDRHPAIVMGGLSRLPQWAMENDLLPSVPVELPPEITTVWHISRLVGTQAVLLWKANASGFRREGVFALSTA